MRKLIIYIFTPFIIIFWHTHAYASIKFGTSEHIRFIANTSLQGPNGEKLFLARKITDKSFILPYTVEDNGFVLGISGESKRYLSFPQGEKLEAIQNAGYLPKPLPIYELDTLDIILGNLLWISLLALVFYIAYKYITRHQKSIPTTSQSPDDQVAHPADVAHYTNIDIHLPLKLYPSKLKVISLLAISVIFVTIGLFMSHDEPVTGYLCAGFFGLGIPVFITQLMPGGSYLELTKDNFTFSSLFRKSTIKWNDIAYLGVVKISRNKMVGWNFKKPHSSQKTIRALNGALTGVEAALPNTYGMKAEQLAELMNEIMKRHLLSQS